MLEQLDTEAIASKSAEETESDRQAKRKRFDEQAGEDDDEDAWKAYLCKRAREASIPEDIPPSSMFNRLLVSYACLQMPQAIVDLTHFFPGIKAEQDDTVDDNRAPMIADDVFSHVYKNALGYGDKGYIQEDDEVLFEQGFINLQQCQSLLSSGHTLRIACFNEGYLTYVPVTRKDMAIHVMCNRTLIGITDYYSKLSIFVSPSLRLIGRLVGDVTFRDKRHTE
jgi:hypothetical protein